MANLAKNEPDQTLQCLERKEIVGSTICNKNDMERQFEQFAEHDQEQQFTRYGNDDHVSKFQCLDCSRFYP